MEPKTFGKTEPRQAIAGVEHLLVEVREPRSQTANPPILSRRVEELAVVLGGDLSKGRPFPLSVHEDRAQVGHAPGTAAARLPAQTGDLLKASLEERLMVAEGAEDLREFRQEPMQLLAVGARVVGTLGPVHVLGEGDNGIQGRSQ